MLYIFDLDNTLVVTYETPPLPGVPERLQALVDAGHKLAVATNQAGLAWGVKTHKPKYPDPISLGQRFQEIATRLPTLARVPWFVAVGDTRLLLDEETYAVLARDLTKAAGPLTLYASGDPVWRKPAPGMLLAACAWYGLTPADAVFVGDVDTDAEAAAAAGTDFVLAAEFFAP